jgi:hypothetical protein
MKTPKGFFTYFHHFEVLQTLSDAQAGRLYKALLRYGCTGELPDFSAEEGLNVAFTLFRVEIDYNFARYTEISETRSKAAKKSAQARRAKAGQDDQQTQHLSANATNAANAPI